MKFTFSKYNFFYLLKASRAQVLKSATEYIHNLKTKNHVHQKTIEDIKRQNAILEFQSKILLLLLFIYLFFFIFSLSSRTNERNKFIYSKSGSNC